MKAGDTITVCIGNSDNKLSQKRWSEFVDALYASLGGFADQLLFGGCSDGGKPWQNAAVIFRFNGAPGLREKLEDLAFRFNQESIALVSGQTDLVAPARVSFRKWTAEHGLNPTMASVAGKFRAAIEDAEYKHDLDGIVLYPAVAEDESVELALLKLLEKISGRWLVVRSLSEQRMDFLVPRLVLP